MAIERRLTAILAADVAGYSRLTGLDEEGTHVQLAGHLRSLVDPKIAEHRGRIVKNTGDGLLAEFSSVVDAVRCAVEIQQGMAERNAEASREKRIEFRIGINVGDVMIERGDIFGDGVNVAARLEGIAEPGGISVSGRVLEDVQGKLDILFENAGEQQLKNIARPVRVYRARMGGAAPAILRPALALPDKPSIAVLPFQNFSGDPEQEYFADGVVEDITIELSRFPWLFVIARNSSFTYKGRAVDVRQVARSWESGTCSKAACGSWGAGYVSRASLLMRPRGRISGRTVSMVASRTSLISRIRWPRGCIIAPKLERAEIERSKRKPTERLDAYDYYLRARAATRRWTREANDEALRLLYRAIELDPRFASAYGMAAWCHVQRKARGWMIDSRQESAEAARLAWRAVDLGKDDALALCLAGYALAYIVHDLESGAAFIHRALLLNPNLATGRSCDGWVKVWLGEPEPAIQDLAHAMRLSPLDPSMGAMQGAVAFAHFLAGRYHEASSWAERASREQPDFLLPVVAAAASNALAGRLEEAQKAIEHLHDLHPALRISDLENLTPFRKPQDLARFKEGLRKAGLPE